MKDDVTNWLVKKEIQTIESCWGVFNVKERITAIKNSWYNPKRYIRGKIEKNYKKVGAYEEVIRNERYGGDFKTAEKKLIEKIKKKHIKRTYFIHKALEPIGNRLYRRKEEDNIIEDMWYHLSVGSKKEDEKEKKKDGLNSLVSTLKSHKKTKDIIVGILDYSGIRKKAKEELSLEIDDNFITGIETKKEYDNYFELFDDVKYSKDKRLGRVRSWVYRHPHLTSAILLTATSYSLYYVSKNIGGFLDSLHNVTHPAVMATPTPTIPSPTPVETVIPTFVPTQTPTATPMPTPIKMPEPVCPTDITNSTLYDSKGYIQQLTFVPSGGETVIVKDGDLNNAIILSEGIKDTKITFHDAGEHNVSIFSKLGEKWSELCKSFNFSLEKLPEPIGRGSIPDGGGGGGVVGSASSAPPSPPGRRGDSVR